jgi:putative chitinase
MTFLLTNSVSFLKCFKKYAINTPLRVAHFLAQLDEESGGYTRFDENMNYSADQLTKLFGSRISHEQAQKYGRSNSLNANKEMIANIIYGGAWGKKNLGNIQVGDGWKFRGRGLIQITGRANYQAYKSYSGIDVVANPSLASTPSIAIDIAGWYWTVRTKLHPTSPNGLNKLADSDKIKTITKIINGGQLNIDKRIENLAKYKKTDTLAILKKKIKPIRSKSVSSSSYGYWGGLSAIKNKPFSF